MQKSSPKTVRVNLSKAVVDSLKPPKAGRTYVYDTKQPGLAVCVTSAGTKTFYVYRKLNGKPERIRLGRWPDMNVGVARDAAADVVGRIATGQDPASERRVRRQSPTFREMFDVYIEMPTRTKSKRPKSAKTKKDYRLQFDGYLADWHDRKMATVKQAEIEALHNKLAADSGTYTANRVLALVKALYAAGLESGKIAENPAAGIRPYEEESRERFLTPEELPRFFAALEAEPSVNVRDFVYLALYTGQRRGNVLSMRWADVDLTRGVWTIPATKTGKHQVPLTEPAVEVLRRRAAAKGANDEFVLPGRHGRSHLKDPMRQWREILKRSGIQDLRIHDLRRTLGSWQAITGASLPVIGKTLGHTRPETTAIYSRLNDDPVRSAMSTATKAIIAAGKPNAGEEESI